MVSSGNWRGLSFDPDLGVLWATWVGGTFGQHLYRVDPETGVGTAIGTPKNFVQGLANEWQKPASVPVRAKVAPAGGGPARG